MVHRARQRRGALVDPGAAPRHDRVAVQGGGAGEHEARDPGLACQHRQGAGPFHIDAMELGVGHQPHVRGVQRRAVDDRIHARQRGAQRTRIGDIAHVPGGVEGAAVHPDHLVPCGQRAKDRAPHPA
ncbi:hypothetical protein D3C86_1132900 [compost metagenome]